jgi:hypothetical protein
LAAWFNWLRPRLQQRALRELLASYQTGTLHHGDCVGADAEAHDIAVALGWAAVIYPSNKDELRAWKSAPDIRMPRSPLSRKNDIVRAVELLIAVPAKSMEQRRSGTWPTVRFGIKLKRPVQIIQPAGGVVRIDPPALAAGGSSGERLALQSVR